MIVTFQYAWVKNGLIYDVADNVPEQNIPPPPAFHLVTPHVKPAVYSGFNGI